VPEKYVAAKTVSLKAHQDYGERWLQKVIADDPTVLGLGELEVRDAERPQPYAGRLDLLLVDPESRTRYEVEIQLGATDESHIVRTIEYWDNERRRYPDREHVAVIVAEDITSRFLNVISLFNRAIPLVAIQLRALDVGGVLTLHATKVLDLTTFPVEEEEAEHQESADRAYWERRGTRQTISLVDRLLTMIHEVIDDAELAPKYNKYYIGLAKHGIADNFVTMRPRKTNLIVLFKIPRSEELSARLDDAGFDTLPYDARWSSYRVRLTANDFASRHEVLADMIKQASGSRAAD
jgi:hypothetical protein